ncbi:MAG: hypothetical protein JWQ73_4140, partial [Variovorax sp.]|nr:hypothetical protein [Variovorax sp.]
VVSTGLALVTLSLAMALADRL